MDGQLGVSLAGRWTTSYRSGIQRWGYAARRRQCSGRRPKPIHDRPSAAHRDSGDDEFKPSETTRRLSTVLSNSKTTDRRGSRSRSSGGARACSPVGRRRGRHIGTFTNVWNVVESEQPATRSLRRLENRYAAERLAGSLDTAFKDQSHRAGLRDRAGTGTIARGGRHAGIETSDTGTVITGHNLGYWKSRSSHQSERWGQRFVTVPPGTVHNNGSSRSSGSSHGDPKISIQVVFRAYGGRELPTQEVDHPDEALSALATCLQVPLRPNLF